MPASELEFRLLGPLEVVHGGERIELGRRRERALLAILLLHANEVVASERLIEELWGEAAGVGAANLVQVAVSRLRRALGEDGVLRTQRPGYVVVVDEDELDLLAFQRRIARARQALSSGDATDAGALLTEAFALWRGPPLFDFQYDSWAQPAAARIEELHAEAVELRIDTDLALGTREGLIGELEQLIERHPLRERLRGQLMLALYRSGRQAEALEAYRAARMRLVDELGVEPSPALRRLEQAILVHDPALAPIESPQREASTDGPDSGHVSNVPLQLSSFVGRAAERHAIADRLLDSRLVTLTGLGGVGKTRLSIAVSADIASRFDRVWFVDLTPARDANAVVAITSAVVGADDQPGRTALASLIEQLTSARSLVILDNCEHILEPVMQLVKAVLARAPELRILATSRESIGAPGEAVVSIAPLEEADAVSLFVQCASAVDQHFVLTAENGPAVAAICRRLDCIPLALELAGAHAHALSASQIDARLGDRFALLQEPARGHDQRHQTIDATLDWSYELLDCDERAVLEQLAVFRGSFSLEATEFLIAGGPTASETVCHVLLRLVRKSLVVALERGPARRYRLLETVREYASRRLVASGMLDHCRQRHFEWVMELCDNASSGLAAADQVRWLDTLADELDNLEAALSWSLTEPVRAARSLPAISGLGPFWLARGIRRTQGVKWLQVTAAAAINLDVAARTEALLNAVLLVIWNDLVTVDTLAKAALRLAGEDERARAHAELAIAWTEVMRGAGSGAAERARSAARGLGPDSPFHVWALAAQGMAGAGVARQAHDTLVEAANRCRAEGDEHMYGAWLGFAADFAAALGDDAVAIAEARESVVIAKRVACDSCESSGLASLALVGSCGDEGGPLRAARRSLELAHGIRETFGALFGLEVVAGALADNGQHKNAIKLAAAAATLRTATGFASFLPGRAAYHSSRVEQARATLGLDLIEALVTEGASLEYEAALTLALETSAACPVRPRDVLREN